MKLAIAALVLSVLLNLYLGGSLFDAAISLDHCRMEQAHTADARATALALMSEAFRDRSEAELRALIRRLPGEDLVAKERDGEVSVGDVVFAIADGQIRSVGYVDWRTVAR